MALDLTFLGHAGFMLDDGSTKVVIDPFLTGNPLATMGPEDVDASAIILTHGHEDHIGDTLAIAERTSATVIGVHEVSLWAAENGRETIGANPGGKIETNWGWVAFTQAHHSSSFDGRYMGVACGVVVRMGGVTVYHCGDTGLFSDMKLIGEIYQPDVACIPIGDVYTMGPELATRAAEWIGAATAIPIHYRTFPVLAQDAGGFRPEGVEVRALEPGETARFGD